MEGRWRGEPGASVCRSHQALDVPAFLVAQSPQLSPGRSVGDPGAVVCQQLPQRPPLPTPACPPAVLQGEYLGQKVAVKNIKCDVTAQAFLDETAVMT